MKRVIMVAAAVALVLAIVAGPAAAAGPQIQGLTSPTHPYEWSSYYSNDPTFTWSAATGPTGFCPLPRYARVVALAEDYAYVADEGGLEVVNVATPGAPFVEGFCSLPHAGFSVAVSGDFAYVGDLWGGLQVVDVGNAATPHIEGTCDLPGCAKGVAVSGDYVYVATAADESDTSYPSAWTGLQVVAVHNPAVPSLAGFCYMPNDAWGVAVAGDYAYVGDGWGGLQVVDVANPMSPSIAGSCGLPGFARSVAVAGDYAYVADSYAGLQVVRISDLASLEIAGACSLPDYAIGVAVAGSHAYVGAMWAGLQIVDVSVPSAPFVDGNCGLPGQAEGVATAGDNAYVANGDGGLQIVGVPLSTDFAYSFSLDADYSGDPGTTIDPVADPAAPSVTIPDVANGTSYFHVRAVALDANGGATGEWGPVATFQITVDHTPRIENLWSATNPPWGWSNCNDPTFTWTAAPPEAGTCSFSYSLDREYSGEPDLAADPVADPANPLVALKDVADGTSYFHVRARDAEGTWGPTATYQLNIDATGPATLALSYKTTKQGAIWLQYSVSDNMNNDCHVTIDIKTSAGKLITTMDMGWKQCNVAFTAVVPVTLKKGSYRYVVHATDWLGNPESKAGSASFVVR